MRLADVILADPAFTNMVINSSACWCLVILDRNGMIDDCNQAFVSGMALTQKPLGRSVREFLQPINHTSKPGEGRVADNGGSENLFRVVHSKGIIKLSKFRVKDHLLLAGEIQSSVDIDSLEVMTSVNSELANLTRQLRTKSNELAKAIREKDAVNVALRNAMAEIKTLKELIAICSSCGKFRNEKGEWMPVEDYIKAYTNTKFTHGFCNDCLRKLFPEDAEDVIRDLG